MKLALAICTFGGLNFTKLAVRSILETYAGKPEDLAILVIVGKHDDTETFEWVQREASKDDRFHWLRHCRNYGFSASCNDMMDFAFINWMREPFDGLVIMGNDVVAYPGAIKALTDAAEAMPDCDTFSGWQLDARSLVARYPEARQYFKGGDLKFTDFDARPWELHRETRDGIADGQMCDVQNFTLFRRSAFAKAGYFDTGYAFNAFYGDNDFCLRNHLIGVKSCTVNGAGFFHFTSRTARQEPSRAETHDRYFQLNEHYYRLKWGGLPGHETFALPFNGAEMIQFGDVTVRNQGLKISSRADETAIIDYWSKRG